MAPHIPQDPCLEGLSKEVGVIIFPVFSYLPMAPAESPVGIAKRIVIGKQVM